MIGGECKSVTEDMTSSWNEITLPTILSNYKMEDIFNADKFGLFCNVTRIKPTKLKVESAQEEKTVK